jgi:uncharacterized OB-fold protein
MRLVMADASKPIPSPTDATQPFWQGCSTGVLRLRRCSHCDRFRGPSRMVCECGQADFVWADASGRGAVFSYTVLHRAPDPAFRGDVPYVVAVIALEEGPYLLANLIGRAPDRVSVGMRVQAVFDTVAPDIGVVKFAPREAGA